MVCTRQISELADDIVGRRITLSGRPGTGRRSLFGLEKTERIVSPWRSQ